MRKLDHGPAAPKIARPSIHPNPSSRFRRTSIAPPTDDSQITQHRIPTPKSDTLLGGLIVVGAVFYLATSWQQTEQQQSDQVAYQWNSPDIPKDAFRFEIFSDMDAGEEISSDKELAEIARQHLDRIFPPGTSVNEVDTFFDDLARMTFAEDQKLGRSIYRTTGRKMTRSCGETTYDGGKFCSQFASKLSVQAKNIHWCRYENVLPKAHQRAEMPWFVLIWDVCIGTNRDHTIKSWHVNLGSLAP